MKSRQWPLYVTTGAVVLSSLALLAALTYALSGVSWQKAGRRLEIDFPDVTGIRLHSAIRYAGAVAGEVTGIRYLTPEERLKEAQRSNAVRVTVRLGHDVPPLTTDVKVTLSSDTVMGEKFIALSAGDPAGRPLPADAIIQGAPLVTFDTLARSADDMMGNLNVVLARFNQDYGDLVSRLQTLLNHGGSVLLQTSNLMDHAQGAVSDAGEIVAQLKSDYPALAAQLSELLANGSTVATNATRTLDRVNGLVADADHLVVSNEDRVADLLNQLRVVAQNLKVVTTYAKALTGTLGEKPSRVIWGTRKQPLPSELEILESSEPVQIPGRNK